MTKAKKLIEALRDPRDPGFLVKDGEEFTVYHPKRAGSYNVTANKDSWRDNRDDVYTVHYKAAPNQKIPFGDEEGIAEWDDEIGEWVIALYR